MLITMRIPRPPKASTCTTAPMPWRSATRCASPARWRSISLAAGHRPIRYGEIGLAQGGPLYQFTHLNAPSVAGNTAYQETIARRSIFLDDASTTQNRDPITYPAPGLSAGNTLRAGDTLPASTSGVLDQRFDLYRIQPTGVINWTHSNAALRYHRQLAARCGWPGSTC
jgi:predicted extracellular nuclease